MLKATSPVCSPAHTTEAGMPMKSIIASASVAIVMAAASANAQAPSSAPRAAAPILIKNATVMTVTRGTLTNTDLLLRDGKIAQIGKGLTAPAGAITIDATGKF